MFAVKVFVVNGGRDAEHGVPAGVYTKNVVYSEVLNSVFTHFAPIDGLAGMQRCYVSGYWLEREALHGTYSPLHKPRG
jgi:hypothetical protein